MGRTEQDKPSMLEFVSEELLEAVVRLSFCDLLLLLLRLVEFAIVEVDPSTCLELEFCRYVDGAAIADEAEGRLLRL